MNTNSTSNSFTACIKCMNEMFVGSRLPVDSNVKLQVDAGLKDLQMSAFMQNPVQSCLCLKLCVCVCVFSSM